MHEGAAHRSAGAPSLHCYVVTTRPGGPLEQVAGHPTEASTLVILDLLDLRPEQVRRYVAAQGRSDDYERIRRHVEGLASSPFLLWAVTRALDSAPSGTAVHSRGGLLRNLIDYYIYEVRERGKAAPRPTTYNCALVKKPVLARLALRMSGEERTAIPEDLLLWQDVLAHLREIERTYEGILELTPEVFMPADRTAAGLLDEVVDNGVLIREAGTLRFLHESVQEYFAAVTLLKVPPHVLAGRAPESSLGRYHVGGSDVEVLVTLAGLLDRAAAGSLAVALLLRNPLLAARVGQEAELRGAAAEPLWNHYVELLDSRHEGRRLLGLRCLSVFPCSRQDVVARLIDQLKQPWDLRQAAKEALENVATDDVLRWMGDPVGRRIALGEARRWLPDDAAREILVQAAQVDDLNVTGWANWSLASRGDVKAWRRLLARELEAPPDFVSFVSDVIRRMPEGSPDAERLVIAAREVLVPVLEADDGQQKTAALEIASRLLAVSADPTLLATASRVTDELGRASQPQLRATAVRGLLRLRPDGGDLPLWLLEENDPSVQDAARQAMGEDAAQVLIDGLREAILKASPQEALRFARLLPGPALQKLAVELLAGPAAADPPQVGTTLVALEGGSPQFSDDALSSLKDQVLAVLDGPKSLAAWRLYCRHAASLAEHRLGVALLGAVMEADNPERLGALAKEAARCWPTDINPPWYVAWADLECGRTEEAITGFRHLADDFPADINHLGLASAFSQLEDPGEALRHARLAVEQDDQSSIAHFLVGWYAYLVGEFDASVESSRQAIELDPFEPAAYANLGVAMLCQGHSQEAWQAYRRFVAVVRRSDSKSAIRRIEDALTDLDAITDVPAAAADVVARICALLEEERGMPSDPWSLGRRGH